MDRLAAQFLYRRSFECIVSTWEYFPQQYLSNNLHMLRVDYRHKTVRMILQDRQGFPMN